MIKIIYNAQTGETIEVPMIEEVSEIEQVQEYMSEPTLEERLQALESLELERILGGI